MATNEALLREELALLQRKKELLQAEPPDPLMQIIEAPGKVVGAIRGGIENALQLLTGAVAAPAAGIAGIAETLRPGGPTGPEAIAEEFGRIAFEPKTETGKAISSAIAVPFEKFEQFADVAGEVSGDPEDVLGATLVKTAILGAPALLGLRGRVPVRPTPRQQLLQTAQQEGLVIPPATAGQSSAASLLEGVGGKLRTAQQASVKNQPVVNRLAAKAVGLPDDVPITPEVLSNIRQQAGQVYESVRNVGVIKTDAAFQQALTKAKSRFESAAKDFPEVAKNEIVTIIDDLNKSSFQAASAVDAIHLLRNKADKSFRAGEAAEGRAFKQASNALESVIERHLKATGADAKLIEGFRDARQTIAKTYTVENALQGTSVSATKLAQQLRSGKPLSGELELVARFAAEFPKAARTLNESFPAFSPLDYWTAAASSGAAISTGSPALLAPAAISAARPAIRSALLSPAGQRLTTPKPTPVVRPTAPAALAGAAVSGQVVPQANVSLDPMLPLRQHSQRSVKTGMTFTNPDGRVSSVRSGSVEDSRLNQGRPTLIPFLWDGKIVGTKEAIKRAIDSGQQWPSFDSNEDATRASRLLSESLE